MRARVVVTAVWGLTLGVWIYLDQKQIDLYSQSTYELLHALAFELTLLIAIPILVGMFVRRWWVVAPCSAPSPR